MKAIDWQSNDGYSTAAVQRLMNNIKKKNKVVLENFNFFYVVYETSL